MNPSILNHHIRYVLQLCIGVLFIAKATSAEINLVAELMATNMRVTWNSSATQIFQLQGRQSLQVTSSWSTLLTLEAGTGQLSTTVVTNVLAHPWQFYRIVDVSDPKSDPDDDGLENEVEILFGTSRISVDTDNDGLPDGWEVRFGLNPLSRGGENGGDGDPDSDGIHNIDELARSTSPRVGRTESIEALQFELFLPIQR